MGTFTFKNPIDATAFKQNNTDISSIYTAKEKIALEYDSSHVYNTGDLVWHEENLYRCTTDNSTGPWSTSSRFEVVDVDLAIKRARGQLLFDRGCDYYNSTSALYGPGSLTQYKGTEYVSVDFTNGSFDSTKWQVPGYIYQIYQDGEYAPKLKFFNPGARGASGGHVYSLPTMQNAVGTVANLYDGDGDFADFEKIKSIAFLGNIYVGVPVSSDATTTTMDFFPAHVYGQVVLDSTSKVVQSMQNLVVKYCDANGTWTDISASDAPNFYIFAHAMA